MGRARKTAPQGAGLISPSRVRSIHHRVLSWFMQKGRKFPWRGISDPYRILVSEIMLQQTQVSRVLQKYDKFLHEYPSLRALARAKQRDVIVAWRGMGYNNRAVRLLRLARAVQDTYHGNIPAEFDALIALPGIGRYTANALLSSAFGTHVPVVDVNVRRFLSRLCWRTYGTFAMRHDKEIWQLAEVLLPGRQTYTWNQALMDIGATICTARQPRCAICPVASLCQSRTLMRRTPHYRAKREPSFHGIPNRIYRGRIIEVLRNHKRIRADLLGRMIHRRYSDRDERWLHGILNDLSNEGLIILSHNGSKTITSVTLA